MEIVISIISIVIAIIALGVSYLAYEKSRSLSAASRKSELIVEATLLLVETQNHLNQVIELESTIKKNSSDENAKKLAAVGHKNCDMMLEVAERLVSEIRETSIEAMENDLDQYTELKGLVEAQKIKFQAVTKDFDEIKSRYENVV